MAVRFERATSHTLIRIQHKLSITEEREMKYKPQSMFRRSFVLCLAAFAFFFALTIVCLSQRTHAQTTANVTLPSTAISQPTPTPPPAEEVKEQETPTPTPTPLPLQGIPDDPGIALLNIGTNIALTAT